mgnify:CR=1 FL=1
MNKYFVVGIATVVALILAHFVSGVVGVLVLAAAVFAYEYLAPSSTVSSVDVPQTASSAPATTASPLAAEPALNSVAQTSTEVLADCESSLANIISTHNDAVDTLSTSFIGLRGLVDQQGSGLVFMPGQRGRQMTFLDHPLGELIPVTYDRSKAEGNWTPSEANFKLTTTGKGHFLTMLAADEFLNENIWKNLPGFFWCAGVERARPGSQVLATHSSMRTSSGYIPVLATRPWGGGEVLFMGTDAAWRWRRGVEDTYHYRFWGQVVRWMSHKRKMAQGVGVRLTYSPENPKVGDEVFMQATLLDLSSSSLNQTLRANVKGPDGKTRDLEFAVMEGGWGVFKGNMLVTEGGSHEVTIYNPNGKQELKTEVLVEQPTLEKLGQPANTKVMREIAERTGGQAGGLADLNKLIGEIYLVSENEAIEERFRLWSNAWWAGTVLFLLAVYWISRKVLGLI